MKVSIITPSLNQGCYIERTLQSVLQQNVPDLEYIIMDGGSTDATLDILNRYANQLAYISEPDQGQANAVNKGLRRATGDIIGWLNSDDIYYPHAITTVCEYFAAHPEIDVIYGDANHIDVDDHIIEQYPTQPWNFKQLKTICYISQPTVFFRRSLLERFGLLDESLNYCMDYEYWLRLGMSHTKFAYIPIVLAGTRLYAETKTLSAPIAAHRETLYMLQKRLGRIPSVWLINHASLLIKQKTSWRFPEWRFAIALWGVASYLALSQGGLRRGLTSVLCLPLSMLHIYKIK